MNKREVLMSLQQYSLLYPNENIVPLSDFVANEENPFYRSNKSGHLTASGLIYHKDKILLIYHNKLQKYIQPGGHIEDSDTSLFLAAQRELKEEVGMDTVPFGSQYEVIPFHIEIQQIPENINKSEPMHTHFDCTFLFSPIHEEIILDKKEIAAYKWISIDENFSDITLKNCVQKLRALKKNK